MYVFVCATAQLWVCVLHIFTQNMLVNYTSKYMSRADNSGIYLSLFVTAKVETFCCHWTRIIVSSMNLMNYVALLVKVRESSKLQFTYKHTKDLIFH